MPLGEPRPSVGAVIVTHNRAEVLQRTLRAIEAQTSPPDVIVVIDSGSTDGTPGVFELPTPRVRYLRCEENIGPAAGRARGMAEVLSLGMKRCWLVDDDSEPDPAALSALIESDRGLHHAGIVGFGGGVVRRGRIIHAATEQELRALASPRGEHLYEVDFALLDGALLRAEAIQSAGLPRDDFFIMMEDVEYPLRLKQKGFGNYVLARNLMDWQHLGSHPRDRATIWRGYYQARNHTRMAMDLGMPSLWIGVAGREAAYVARYIGRRGGGARLRLRGRGIVDAFRGRMGRRVDPDAFGEGT